MRLPAPWSSKRDIISPAKHPEEKEKAKEGDREEDNSALVMKSSSQVSRIDPGSKQRNRKIRKPFFAIERTIAIPMSNPFRHGVRSRR